MRPILPGNISSLTYVKRLQAFKGIKRFLYSFFPQAVKHFNATKIKGFYLLCFMTNMYLFCIKSN